jgi:hypothetical protein
MSFGLVMVMLITPEAVTIANRIEASHLKMSKVGVYVSDGASNAVPTKISFSSTSCRLEMPNQQIADLNAKEIRFYDEIFNQVAVLKNSKTAKMPDEGQKVAIVHREPIAWLLSSTQRAGFFKDLRSDSRWKVIGSSLMLFEPKKNILSEIHFDNSYRVTQIRLRIGNQTLSDWKYRYVNATDVPMIPAGAKVVKGLPPRPTIPSKTDGKSVLFAQKIWRSISRLDGRKIAQTSDEGTYMLTFGKGKLAESGPKGSWVLANTQLVVSPKNGETKTYNGGSDKFLDILRSKGIYTSPISRYVLNRKIPFLDMFDRTDEVKLLTGLVKMDGKSLSILSLKKAGVHIRMYVDPKTGDLAKISSDAIDSAGKTVMGSQLKISYQ